MAKRIKPIEMPKQTFTTVNTAVDEILEELVQWSLNQSSNNLKLKPYEPTMEEEIQIHHWLEQDKKPKER